MRKLIFLSGLLFFQIQLFGQIEEGFRTIDLQDESLNNSRITGIHSDNKGQIWIQSFVQITRYDGSQFFKTTTNNVVHHSFVGFYTQPNLSSPFIVDLSGRIFFIEKDTLRPYQFNSILMEHNPRKLQTDFYMDELGRLHFSFVSNGYKIIDRGEVIDPFMEKGVKFNGVGCIMRDGENPFMFTTDRENNKKDNSNFYLLNEELDVIDSVQYASQGLAKFKPSLVKLSNGNYLMAATKQILHEFNDEGIVNTYDIEDNITGLLVDADNGLWINTLENGILHIENDTSINESVKTRLFSNSTTHALLKDYEGGIWIYNPQNGVQYRKRTIFETMNRGNGLLLHNRVRSTHVTDKTVFVTHDGSKKISVFDLINNRLDSIHFELEGNPLELFMDTVNDRLWASSSRALSFRTNKQWRSFDFKPNYQLSHYYVRLSKHNESSEYSLVGINAGRYFLIQDTIITYFSKKFPAPVLEVLIVDGLRYIITHKGVYTENGTERIFLGDKFSKLKEYSYYTISFNKQIWFAFPDGTYVLEGDSLTPFTDNGKMVINAVLVKHNKDTAFVFSPQGTFLINKNTQNSNSKLEIECYEPHEIVNTFPFAYSNLTSIFFETEDNGLIKAEVQDFRKLRRTPPRFSFFSLRINNKATKLTDSTYNLNYDEGFLQIKYHGISYKNKKISYRYQMEGLGQDWQYTEDEIVQYTTLPPGDYKFKIQAHFINEPWSDSYFLKFKISPPFWKTWWFITILLVVIGTVIYSIFRFRIQIVENEKKLIIGKLKAEQRALRAKMNPHFIFNVISSLQYLISDDKSDKAISFLEGFSLLMRRMVDQSDIEYIAIDKELAFLKGYIDLEKLRFEDKFEYDFKLNFKSEMNFEIPNFILQPIIENSIQHGLKNKKGKGLLTVELTKNEEVLNVVIEDNGVGYNRTTRSISNRNKKHKSKGIETIISRIELHNRNSNIKGFEIRDVADFSDNEGTRVEVNIRIKNNEGNNN